MKLVCAHIIIIAALLFAQTHWHGVHGFFLGQDSDHRGPDQENSHFCSLCEILHQYKWLKPSDSTKDIVFSSKRNAFHFFPEFVFEQTVFSSFLPRAPPKVL